MLTCGHVRMYDCLQLEKGSYPLAEKPVNNCKKVKNGVLGLSPSKDDSRKSENKNRTTLQRQKLFWWRHYKNKD